MPYNTISLTSASSTGLSTPVPISWRAGKPTTVLIAPTSTATSSASAVFWTLQYTMDDITNVVPGSSTPLWLNYSSSAVGVPGTVYSASATGTDGTLFSLLSAVAAVRINSSSLVGAGSLVMKVIQPEGW